MELLRGIDLSPAKQAIVAGLVGIAGTLDIEVLAEGVETEAELTVPRAAGIGLFQGAMTSTRRPALVVALGTRGSAKNLSWKTLVS